MRKILFLMDPLDTVIFEKDTSFILMLAAQEKGHEIYFLPKSGISFQEGTFHFHVQQVVPQNNAEQPFEEKDWMTLTDRDVDAIMIRTDPPFDQQYLFHTWMLERLQEKIVIANDPAGIRTVNEKLWAIQFHDLTPRTLVTQNILQMKDFLAQEQIVIAKPTSGFGGQGIFLIKADDLNANVIFETLSDHGREAIILQQYIPDAKRGDKRILLLNGDPLGAVLRVHGQGDHRNNFFAGGHPVAAQISSRDQQVIDTLKPYLRKLGLYFVGIDMLGDYLIEVNVTSPTCLQEMNRLYGFQLHHQVIEFIENLIDQKKT